MTTANVYQQRPDAAAKAESSLHHSTLASLIGQGAQQPGVIVREKKLLGHLTLRGDARDPAFSQGVHHVLGLELPVALTLAVAGEVSVQWMGPDEWLLIMPGGQEFALETALRHALVGLHISVVNVSGGQQLLELSGPKVREVLMKSTSYDVHPDNFPVGKAVGTVFAKSQLVIRHTAQDTWELLIRRSFSQYWWLWLQDAAAEYGLRVET